MASLRESPRRRRALRLVVAALAVAIAYRPIPAFSGPQGGVVQAGSATIAPNGASRLDVIQSSQRAVIDWRSFSIGAGEHVNFVQPSAAAATLNRVVGADSSAILGRLTANGTVFLINPNGILIGPGAKIDVGGLVAATADLSNENFMAGRYRFDRVVNRDAVIVNRGEITARAGGLVALVAPGVENSGVIRAQLGKVALASGNAFTLDLFGDKLISFAVDDKIAARLTDASGRPLAAYVNQSGVVEADGGSVLIAANAARTVLDNVVNVSGVVRATSFEQQRGEIVLHGGEAGAVRVAGTLDVSGKGNGQTGGRVDVLGADVALEPGSRIDASGDARGGAVEVSGTRSLAFAGDVNVSARSGPHGTLLLDPDSLTIDAPTATAVANVLRTGASEVRMAADTITVEEPIDGRGGAAGGGLTLKAGNRIAVNNDIITNDGEVLLDAGARGVAMGAGPKNSVTGGNGTIIHAGAAKITLTSSGDIEAQHLVTTGAVTIETTAPDRTIVLAGLIVAGADVRIGSRSPAPATDIMLRNDIHTTNADIELNGRTWIDPIVQPGDSNVSFSDLFRLRSAARYYEVPVVQVSLQTDGAGSVRLNGDVLWGGDLTSPENRPHIRYLYNVFLPPASGRPTPEQIAATRDGREPAATGYYGLNVSVRDGTVHFGGNLGAYDEHGIDLLTIEALKPFVLAPERALGSANNAAALLVAVRTPSYSNATGQADVTFAPATKVKVARFEILNPDPPDFDATDISSSADARILTAPPETFAILPNRGLPKVEVINGGPNLIGPSPRSVATSTALASIGPLPEIPVGIAGAETASAALNQVALQPGARSLDSRSGREASFVLGTSRVNDPVAHADFRHGSSLQGALTDVFSSTAPLVTWRGRAASGADPRYFSQGPFEFARSRSTPGTDEE